MKRTLALESTQQIGSTIKLQGWVNSARDHGGLIFIDLRDHSGIVQITCNPEVAKDAYELATSLKDESVIEVVGVVKERDAGLVNPKIDTGTIEVFASELLLLNPSLTPPFPIFHPEGEVNEDLRLKYRFLDLRRPKMQEMLKKRSEFNFFIHNWMHKNDFVEVATPILTSSSPEGARDFLVPSRLHPGKFYALPQAPQQFKQLLMVGGVPRYYQIAPCFRDEDPRADRHPGEFYQLDLEIGFAQNDSDVIETMEPMVVSLTESMGKKIVQTPFPRIPYKEAIARYGTDKPDLRFGMEIHNVSSIFTNTEFSVFKNAIAQGGNIQAICARGASTFSRSQIDQLTEFVRKEGMQGLAYITYTDEGLKSPILKFLSEGEIGSLTQEMNAETGDVIFFAADTDAVTLPALGKLRGLLADTLALKDPNLVAYAWIVDFPMFEWSDRDKKIDFSHNPFSMPKGGIEALNTQDPLTILANQYDLACNGYEILSGGIRNYNPEWMYRAFEIVGTDKETVNQKFSGMIQAFSHGAPPHGGCAFGLDRWFMTLNDEPNIREVIAFPKNGSALDLMMRAPGEVDDKQLKELHIKIAE